MIYGIGSDIIEVARFADWHTKSRKTLIRIFSAEEVDYCLQTKTKSAERFAVRFAAREAAYKAVCAALPQATIPFLTFCKAVHVLKKNNVPHIKINWDILNIVILENDLRSARWHITLSHNNSMALAWVILEKAAL